MKRLTENQKKKTHGEIKRLTRKAKSHGEIKSLTEKRKNATGGN